MHDTRQLKTYNIAVVGYATAHRPQGNTSGGLATWQRLKGRAPLCTIVWVNWLGWSPVVKLARQQQKRTIWYNGSIKKKPITGSTRMFSDRRLLNGTDELA